MTKKTRSFEKTLVWTGSYCNFVLVSANCCTFNSLSPKSDHVIKILLVISMLYLIMDNRKTQSFYYP